MEDQDFQSLVMKVLAREATPSETDLLESLMAKDKAREMEFHSMKQTVEIFREGLPLAQALKAGEPELPAYRWNELQAAVGREFGEKEQRAVIQQSTWSLWYERFSFKAAFAGALAMAAIVVSVMVFSFPQAREIEIGMYKDFATRGSGDSFVAPVLPDVTTVVFQKEEDFEKWKKESLPQNQKARIWIDEETGSIRLLWRDTHGNIQEISEALAGDLKQREKQLERMVRSLLNDQPRTNRTR